MKRIFAAALTIFALTANASASGAADAAQPVVPQPDRGRIAARFGSSLLPSWVPPGYVYVGWKELQGTTMANGASLVVDFAKRGLLLEWVVGDGRDENSYAYDACTPDPRISPTLGDRLFKTRSTRVLFHPGNHGATAATCVTKSLRTRFTDASWQGTGVYVWSDSIARLSPETLGRMLASMKTAVT